MNFSFMDPGISQDFTISATGSLICCPILSLLQTAFCPCSAPFILDEGINRSKGYSYYRDQECKIRNYLPLFPQRMSSIFQLSPQPRLQVLPLSSLHKALLYFISVQSRTQVFRSDKNILLDIIGYYDPYPIMVISTVGNYTPDFPWIRYFP